ncbi:MAG TPA: AI-2E family transporter [Terriglobia bacterium]|nr:AI-2E family transporter [Terriglobia bacterium]
MTPNGFPPRVKTTTSDRLSAILSYGILLLLIYFVFRICQPFLAPLGWAAVLVIFFHPMHKWLLRRFAPRKAAMLSTLTVTLLLIVPSIFVTTLFVRQALSIARGLQQTTVGQHAPMLTSGWQWMAHRVPLLDPNVDVLKRLVELVRERAGSIGEQIGATLRNTLVFIFDLFVMIFAMFYFFDNSDQLIRALRNVLPFDPVQREAMITQARNLISASVGTSLALAAIQGVLGGLSFAIVRLPESFFWGVAMAFFSLVPVVGSGIVFVPAALWLGFTGHWGSALVVLAICAGVSAVIDNVVRPMLLGGRTEMNTFEIFISVVGGIAVFGMMGLVLGPVLVATAHSILAVYTQSVEDAANSGEAGAGPSLARLESQT